MKTLIGMFTVLLITYTAWSVASQTLDLWSGQRARIDEHFEEALYRFNCVKNAHPAFMEQIAQQELARTYYDWAVAKTSNEPKDFVAAGQLLTTVIDDADFSRHYGDLAKGLLRKIPYEHFNRAHDLCAAGNHDQGIREFQLISHTYAGNKELLSDVKSARARCMVAKVTEEVMNNNSYYTFSRIIPILTDADVNTYCGKEITDLVHTVIKRELTVYTKDNAIIEAFEYLGRVRRELEDQRQILDGLKATVYDFQHKVLGAYMDWVNVDYIQPKYIGPPKDNSSNKATVCIINSAPCAIRVMCRNHDSRRSVNIDIPKNGKKSITLEPDKYLIGVKGTDGGAYVGIFNVQLGSYETTFTSSGNSI